MIAAMKNRVRLWRAAGGLGLLAAGVFALTACGSAGSSDSSDPEGTSGGSSVHGTVVGSNGDQSALANWAVALIERDTGIARVAVLDSAGLFHLSKVNMDQPVTLVLLTPDFKFTSVLAMTSPISNTVKQYFMPQTNLPKLIHRSQIMTFFSEDDIIKTDDISVDGDADLIPDGLDPDALALRRAAAGLNLVQGTGAQHDFDKDGVPDVKDPDIDGDGIPNWFDTDADGDLIPNAFDGDANGNIVNDATETEAPQYFKDGIEFLAVQVERAIERAGTVTSTVTIAGKVRDGVAPLAIDVRGAPSLFNGATINNITKNADGEDEIIPSAWDKRLMDDSLSNDGAKDDRVYARKVELQTGKVPKTEQVLFVRLAFGDSAAPWFVEFPYTFPDVTTKDIEVRYDRTLKRVTLVGSPYGSQKSFTWYVDVIGTIDEKTATVHTSPELNGENTTTYVLPTATLESGAKYKIRARAQAKDKVPSYPSYIVTSPELEITYE
jgi:hypothetical protein